MRCTIVGNPNFRPFRNVWMLEELGIPYDIIPAQPLTAEARKYHPMGKVPALYMEFDEGDGQTAKNFVMTESAAINTFLGDHCRKAGIASENPLVPPVATIARGKYDQMVCTIMSELDAQALWIHSKHERLGGIIAPKCPEAVETAKAQFDTVVQSFAATLQENAKHMEDSSAEGPFLLTPHFGFSAADILLSHCLIWGEMIGWGRKWRPRKTSTDDAAVPEVEGEMTYLKEYIERIKSRPGYLKAAEVRKKYKLS